MEKSVLVVDTSGSMKCHEIALKNYLKLLIDAFTHFGRGPDEVALVSFSNDVSIESKYGSGEDHVAELKNLVDALHFGGLTSFNDGILVGLTFENPKPDYVHVFSDSGDNCSDATEDHWSSVASHMGILVHQHPPSDDTYRGDCRYARYFTTTPITLQMAKANVLAVAKRVKMAKVITGPEDLMKFKPVNKEALAVALRKPRIRRVLRR